VVLASLFVGYPFAVRKEECEWAFRRRILKRSDVFGGRSSKSTKKVNLDAGRTDRCALYFLLMHFSRRRRVRGNNAELAVREQ
jgi:hypothetical protein